MRPCSTRYTLCHNVTNTRVPRCPGDGAITVGAAVPQNAAFVKLPLLATGRGRVRVLLTFSDGTTAAAHYYVLPPFATQVARLGSHLAHVAWLPREYPDPFGRAAAVLPWDRETKTHVLNDARAYDVGLSDDAGGGAYVCITLYRGGAGPACVNKAHISVHGILRNGRLKCTLP